MWGGGGRRSTLSGDTEWVVGVAVQRQEGPTLSLCIAIRDTLFYSINQDRKGFDTQERRHKVKHEIKVKHKSIYCTKKMNDRIYCNDIQVSQS